MRILVVEEDQQLQRIFSALIARDPAVSRRRPEIVVARDGVAALIELDGKPFDLIVTDLLLAGMNGFDFCRQVRTREHARRVPLIATSAIYRDAATIRALEAETGCEFYAKPFQLDDLMHSIRRKLIAPPVKAPAATANAPVEVIEPQPSAPRPLPPSSGSLTTMPVPRLLLELWDARATGTLKLMRKKAQKELALVNGTPVAVTSNARAELLGHFLVGRGVLTEQQHQAALQHARIKNDRLGGALIELGWVKQAELLAELGEQLRFKIVNSLRWNDGEFYFEQTAPTDRTPTAVDLPKVIFDGLRKTARPDELAKLYLGPSAAMVVELGERMTRLRDTFVECFGEPGLQRFVTRPLVGDLVTQENSAPFLIQLDALTLCGLATLVTASIVVPTTPPPTAEAPSPLGAVLYDSLFEGLARSSAADPTPPMRAEEASGLLQISDLQATARAAKLDEIRNEVLGLYLRLSGKNHYQVLEVPRDAARAQIESAYSDLVANLRGPRYTSVDLGDDATKLREIESLATDAKETLCNVELRTAYDQAIGRGTPHGPNVDAELKVQNAVDKMRVGGHDEACGLLEAAVQLAPDQADYSALLAWARFVANQGIDDGATLATRQAAAVLARPAIEQALAVDADNVRAHEYGANIALRAEQTDVALVHLEHLLQLDPANATALDLFDATSADPHRTERQIRRSIHRLAGTGEVDRTVELWLRLGELYRVRLDDRASALTALGVAVQLRPDDARVRRALATIHQTDPAEWQKTNVELRAWWRLAPDEPEPGRKLFALETKQQRWDRAFLAASALVHRGSADDAAVEFARRYQPRFLQRLQNDLSHAIIDQLRHPDDLAELNAVFAVLARALPSPFRLADLQLDVKTSIAQSQLPPAFLSVLSYLLRVFDLPAPILHLGRQQGFGIHVAATDPIALVVGKDALELDNRLVLGFRLARALSFCWPGRARANAIPTRVLKDQFIAAVLCVHPEMAAGVGENPIGAQLQARLNANPAVAKNDLAPAVDRCLALKAGKLNLAGYARGLARTADRVGFVVCGDLMTAAKIVDEEGASGAADELIDFALSDGGARARAELGLSVEV